MMRSPNTSPQTPKLWFLVSGEVRHSAVIDDDEFERSEAFGDVLPESATIVLERIVRMGH